MEKDGAAGHRARARRRRDLRGQGDQPGRRGRAGHDLVSLVDDIYGNLAPQKGQLRPPWTAPLVLAPGGTYSCSFTARGDGQARRDEDRHHHRDRQAKDNEGNGATDTAQAGVVSITDVIPTVKVDKTADPVTVPELGGPVTFTVRVTNPGGVRRADHPVGPDRHRLRRPRRPRHLPDGALRR